MFFLLVKQLTAPRVSRGCAEEGCRFLNRSTPDLYRTKTNMLVLCSIFNFFQSRMSNDSQPYFLRKSVPCGLEISLFFKSFHKVHIGEGVTEQFGDVLRVMCGSLKLVTQECTLQNSWMRFIVQRSGVDRPCCVLECARSQTCWCFVPFLIFFQSRMSNFRFAAVFSQEECAVWSRNFSFFQVVSQGPHR